MKQRGIFDYISKITNALLGITSSILTNIFYDELSSSHFQVHLFNGAIEIKPISSHPVSVRIVIILVLFFVFWFVLTWVSPVIIYCIDALKSHNKPRYNTQYIIDSYRANKVEILSLQERYSQVNIASDSYYITIFFDACLIVQQLHKVFCVGTRTNSARVKDSFRFGKTIHDMDKKISPCEYLAVTEILAKLITAAYNKVPCATKLLIYNDYKNALKYILDLRALECVQASLS